jgi:UDP-N-acetyl-2-amino-2-deoxyglucuronate dehydrogenase
MVLAAQVKKWYFFQAIEKPFHQVIIAYLRFFTVTSQPLRVGLLGCGRIAIRHADLLSKGLVQGARLVGAVEIDGSRRRAFTDKYAVDCFESVDELLSHVSLDVVAVLTPSGLHASQVINLAPLVKNIIVEKPMALSLDDADKMIAACDMYGSRLFVVKQNRFNVPVQQARLALEQGRFGKLVMGSVRVRWCRSQSYYDLDAWRGTWSLDGGVLANQASHHVDLLQWMFGQVESVMAMSRTALVDIETEDTAIVLLRFSNGALGVIEATTAARPGDLEGSLSILGEYGSVVIGGFAVNKILTWQFANALPEDQGVLDKFSVNPPDVYGFGHMELYRHIVDCIRTGTNQLVDGLEARKSLELINAIYESIETGREVFLRFRPRHSKLGLNA